MSASQNNSNKLFVIFPVIITFAMEFLSLYVGQQLAKNHFQNILFHYMDEVSLYLQIRKGNIAAFEAFFKKYYPSMCAIARKYTANNSVSEDIAQEAFIKLWEKREAYENIPDLKTFLYVSVKNLSLNHIRNKKATVNCSDIEILSNDNFLKDQLIKEETYRIITSVIESLPSQSGRIMKLVLEGKQNQEIAEVLNISVATVKTLKYNAIHTLHEKLINYLYLLIIFSTR